MHSNVSLSEAGRSDAGLRYTTTSAVSVSSAARQPQPILAGAVLPPVPEERRRDRDPADASAVRTARILLNRPPPGRLRIHGPASPAPNLLKPLQGR